MPRSPDSSSAQWRSFLTQTGRVDRVSQLIAAELQLPDAPEGKEFLSVRLARFVDSCGLPPLDALISDGDTAHLRSIVGVQHSWFWREPEQFAYLLRHVQDKLDAGRPIRVWSAATSCGQEAYSLAMVLSQAADVAHPNVQVLGTDLDSLALGYARTGEYDEAMAGTVPAQFRHWLKPVVTKDGTRLWQVRPELRQLVTFRPLDLLSLDWSNTPGELGLEDGATRFDAIFCRNVLMYFGAPYRYAVLEALATFLAPGGLLCLGASEHIGPASQLFDPCGHGMYLRRTPRESRRSSEQGRDQLSTSPRGLR